MMPRMAQLSCEPFSHFNLHAAGPSSCLQAILDCAHALAESALSMNMTIRRGIRAGGISQTGCDIKADGKGPPIVNSRVEIRSQRPSARRWEHSAAVRF